MLDDEDAHDFGAWYETRRRDGSQGSSWSLMSFLGGGKRSRDASITGHSTTSSTPWREKTDPFSDGTPIANDEETGYAAVRPRARREASHISTRSALSYASYTDPFTDPIKEDQHEASDTSYQGDNPVRLVTPRAPPLALRTNFPLEHVGHPLSPLSERTSRSTLPAPESGASSSDNVSRFSATGSLATSNTSHVEPPRSPTLLSNLLPSTTERPVHRSDSWWSRLGRRKSDASGRSVAYPSLRDPNPPPRLVTIDESVHSRSPDKDSPQSKRSSPSIPTPSGSSQQQQQREEHSQPYAGRHGKSMSSLRTADSEAIERIGGTMEVVQRVKSFRSRRGRGSTESTAESSIHTDLSVEREHEEFATYASPTEMDPHESIIAFAPTTTVTPPVALYTNPASGSSAASRPLPVSPSGDVAAKIQAYERQQSQGADEGKHRKGKRHMVDYGLVPRRSLFVANPDNRVSQSSIESS
ncbi:hypothetical protein CC1G_07056 [Coprinopsis cinerea okayama7|uniref:Uncharacterized protein n=1 Tax=Coprinopsis cinerea (strain Okayama-7 / 130 / ATCC MYA-4618 / FGSC 9003) TaxID=240176 RepID=A8NUA2_COPC7|nr:hypothetical protein CC1G_07056 [Coprinopsis cinerea okayama7\|eukprot:XP_001836409.2 hypothetical protein CC1G_07056 [Coprinopsis cinerea okayama7\